MGDWAHRLGASPLMRMTASWSWSVWTDRIQVRGAMLRAHGRAPLRSLWLTPPGAPCRGPQTELDEVGLPPWCGGGRSEYHAAARMVMASMLARASTGVQ